MKGKVVIALALAVGVVLEAAALQRATGSIRTAHATLDEEFCIENPEDPYCQDQCTHSKCDGVSQCRFQAANDCWITKLTNGPPPTYECLTTQCSTVE